MVLAIILILEAVYIRLQELLVFIHSRLSVMMAELLISTPYIWRMKMDSEEEKKTQ